MPRMAEEIKSLVKFYFPIIWLAQITTGVNLGSLGPALPYLASQVGVGHGAAASIFSVRSVGSSIGAVATGRLFDTELFCRNGGQLKLLTMGILQLLTSATFITIPFITNYLTLIAVTVIQGITTIAYDCGANAITVSSMNPTAARPFIQSLHFLLSSGFCIVSFGLPYVLPQSQESRTEICEKMHNGVTGSDLGTKQGLLTVNGTMWDSEGSTPSIQGNVDDTAEAGELPLLFFPFLIITILHLLISCCHFAQVGFRLKLPQYKAPPALEEAITLGTKGVSTGQGLDNLQMVAAPPGAKDQETLLIHTPIVKGVPNTTQHLEPLVCASKLALKPWWPVGLGTVFFALMCGVDGFFVSQTFSFALCGPLGLGSQAAGRINFTFFMAYCLGRLVSIPISPIFSPAVILASSLSGVSLAIVLIVAFGSSCEMALNCLIGIVGFFLCFPFPTGLVFLATRVPGGWKNIHTSMMFVGANIGSTILPPVNVLLFQTVSYTSAYIGAFVCSLLTFSVFLVLFKTTKSCNK